MLESLETLEKQTHDQFLQCEAREQDGGIKLVDFYRGLRAGYAFSLGLKTNKKNPRINNCVSVFDIDLKIPALSTEKKRERVPCAKQDQVTA